MYYSVLKVYHALEKKKERPKVEKSTKVEVKSKYNMLGFLYHVLSKLTS